MSRLGKYGGIVIKLSTIKKVDYPVFLDVGLLKKPLVWLPKQSIFSTIVVITDNRVEKLYAKRLVHALKKEGYPVLLLAFPAGESSKNYQTKQYLEERMLDNHCDRHTLCLALGGGVVGDLVGFIAATYMRGIAYIQIPTTLLAMVDSSIGGKVGINMPQGKNLIGAFWPPKAVVIDLDCLKSLTQKKINCGMVEILKTFLVFDKKSVVYFAHHQNNFKELITRAVNIKIEIVSQDEKEHNQRHILNFGHTIGHAIEKITDYKVLHGEAVGMGIYVESKISTLLGILTDKEYQMIQTLLIALGINLSKLKKLNPDKLVQATQVDKKISKGRVNYVLLKRIGEVYQKDRCVVQAVEDRVVKRALLM